MSQLPRYENYKESGVQWLGDIPSHWKVWKITHAMDLIGSGTTPKSDNLEYYDGDVLWVTTSELRESYIYDTKQKITELAIKDYSALKKHPVNSVAIAMYGATIGRLGILAKEATFNQACCIFSGSKVLYYKFLYYWLWMRRPILISLSNGGGQPNLSQDDLKKLKLAFPPIPEQKIIADFLDKRLAQVDALIAKQETLLEKLAEQRIALISHAVTKGLNPDVKMKESGINTLGKIPFHWKVIKNKFILNFSKGLTITKENLVDEGIPCVSYGEVHSKFGFEVDPNRHELKCVPESYLESDPAALLKKGDFIFADTSEDIKGSGNFTYLNSDTPTFAGYHTIIAKINEVNNPRFLAYVFDTEEHRNQVRMQIKGVKVFSITQAILKNTFVWLPSIKEQNQIVDYLDAEVEKYQQIGQRYQLTIEKLKEYRSTLITQVVTGKIDVRQLSGS
ncbi:restriction endonuclease subunit S [Entomomonas sp. E2T0]|uniref:restriction endonuclease subunit S n=1 Tax=Entomomonas sp. E2T0 TaxID=2930213 RepID=UPI0022284A13|nr:restriction endonuclease subunit S [Entomomonas sp. E2T0]UYZ84870.1 restriction endonuclease subunit S [Entomomonas sp. E2T0]